MTKKSTALALGIFALVTVAAGTACATPPASTCTGKKLKAGGKDAFKELNCWAKAVKTGDSSGLTACRSAEDTKVTDAFTAADTAGDCLNGLGVGPIKTKV